MGNKIIRYWHLCSDELPDKVIFSSHNEYLAGMNSIPIAMDETGVKIYCFTLMSNHVHILLRGSELEVRRFFNIFKIRLSAFISRKEHPLRGLRPKMIIVKDESMFRTEVAYILRNCLKARISDPYTYPWSTGYLYFNPGLGRTNGVMAGKSSRRELRNSLHSRKRIPDSFKIFDGLILPESYVDYHMVEKIFGSSVDFFMRLKDWKVEQENSEIETGAESPFYDDASLWERLQKEFRDYHVSDFSDMDSSTIRRFIRILRNKYGANVKQIRRLTGIDEETILRVGGWK